VSSDEDSDDDSSSSDDDSSSSDDEDSSSDDDSAALAAHTKKKKEEAAVKAKAASEAAANWKPTPPSKKRKTAEIVTERGSDGAQALLQGGTPFKRVDDGYWGEVATKDGGAMADNSYEGVFGADGFGSRASEKLLTVRGKDFRHEKTKRKRSYNGFAKSGGAISMQSFSTKYQYSDEE
jgi:hypothetical protein